MPYRIDFKIGGRRFQTWVAPRDTTLHKQLNKDPYLIYRGRLPGTTRNKIQIIKNDKLIHLSFFSFYVNIFLKKLKTENLNIKKKRD